MNVSKVELQRGLKFATAEASSAAIHNALVNVSFLTGFSLAWGACDVHLGFLGAIPFLMAPFQLVGAYVTDRWPDRRRLSVALFGVLSRCTWLAVAVMPFLCGPSPVRVIAGFLLLYLFHQAMCHASGPGWMAWMAVLVPGRLRGRYLGRRSLSMEVCGMVTLLAAGVSMDIFRAGGLERLGFAVLQGLAGLAGIVCFLLLLRQTDPGHSAPPPENRMRYVLKPFCDASFRKLFTFNVAWLSGTAACAPFYTAHLLKNLHWDFKGLAMLGLLTSMTSIAAYAAWGRRQDRQGTKQVLTVCTAGLLLLPLFYALCPWTLRWPIYMHHLLLGVFLSGFSLAFLHMTFECLPEDGRAMGAAVMAAAAGPVVFLAGVAGGWAAEALEPLTWWFGGFGLGHYQLLFLASIALRAPAVCLLRRLDGHPSKEKK